MMFHVPSHASVGFAATNLEFIMSQHPLDFSTRERLERLKGSVARAYTISENSAFDDLLKAIDEADEGRVRRSLDLQ